MELLRVHNLRERFDDLENENEETPSKQEDTESGPPLQKRFTVMLDQSDRYKLGPEFEDCGFLKVKVHSSLNIADHGQIGNSKCRLTVFILHKILLTAAILAAIILDIKSFKFVKS